MGRRRKTLAERSKTLPARYRADQRMLSWPIEWDSALGIKIMGELASLTGDLGGWEHLSRQRQILVEKVVFLYLWTTQYEAALWESKPLPFDAGAYSNKVNVLMGLLAKLGLDRRATPIGTLADKMRGAA